MNHFINISDLSKNELRSIIDGAKKRKSERGKKPQSQTDDYQPLQGKTMIMIFEKTSTRTRISFDLAVKQLGGSSIILNQDEIHYGKGDETIKDTAKVLSQYADILMIRTDLHKNVDEFKKYLEIPIINGLTDQGHPCQVMSDILTFEELKGNIKGKNIAWIGDGNNVANSLILSGALLGIEVRVACPKGYEPSPYVVNKALQIYKDKKLLKISNDPFLAARGANVLYTDVWSSMGEENKKQDKDKDFKGFTIDKNLLSNTDEDAIVLHCLPAYRFKEITDEVFESKNSRIFQQAENRLHVQQALLACLLS